MTKTPPTISVAIVCSNSAATIREVLESVKNIAFEIVAIVDDQSKDETYQILCEYTSRVSIEPWRGFVGQKNEALKRCVGDWVLSLDSDEVLSPELQQEIVNAVQEDSMEAFFLNRMTVYAGQPMRYAWQKDYRLRLAKRSAQPLWQGKSVHETLCVGGVAKPAKSGFLKAVVYHYSYQNITDHFQRALRYAKDAAHDRYLAGKRFHLIKLIFAPFAAFVKQYIFKKGFLDGSRGLVAAISSAFYSMMKQIYLLEESWNSKNKN